MKKKWIAVFMAVFFGGFGVHRFYLRQPEMGMIYLAIHIWVRFISFFSIPIAQILGWIDAYRYMMMDETEFDRKYNSYNFRDRYGKRREAPAKTQGRYIIIEGEESKEKNKPIKNYNKFKESIQSQGFNKSGVAKLREFNIEGAIQDFNKAIEMDPNDKFVHFNLACAYSIDEQTLNAFKHLDLAVERGFKEWGKIETHDALAYVRINPAFDLFKSNGYRLNSQIFTEIEKNQSEMLESFQLKEKEPKSGSYATLFNEKQNDITR